MDRWLLNIIEGMEGRELANSLSEIKEEKLMDNKNLVKLGSALLKASCEAWRLSGKSSHILMTDFKEWGVHLSTDLKFFNGGGEVKVEHCNTGNKNIYMLVRYES